MSRLRIIGRGVAHTGFWFGASGLVFETGNIIIAFGRSIGGGELTVPGALLGVIGRAWQLGAALPAMAGIKEVVDTIDDLRESK